MLDPLAPVAGLSIERYAELAAEVATVRNDAAKLADLLARNNVSAADWELARSAWSARLGDPATGMLLAARFDTAHHQTLDRLLGPPPEVKAEDFAAMWGEALTSGLPSMWRRRNLDPLAWSRISHRARTALAADPLRFDASMAVAEHLAELRLTDAPLFQPPAPAAAAPAAQPAPAAAGAPAAAAAAAPAAPAAAGASPVSSFDKDATVAAKAVGKAFVSGFGALGAALDDVGKSLLGPSVGAAVLVQWSDGKKYPGTVAQVSKGTYQVTMADGSQHWIPEAFVKPA